MTLESHHEELIATANLLASAGKGLLAADESTGTIGKRFAPINLENTENNRRAYRSLLATTAGLGEFVSGVILFEETLFQDATDGRPIVEHVRRQGIVPGIKVDQGVQPLAGALAPGLLLRACPATFLPAPVGRHQPGGRPAGPAGPGPGQR